MAAIAGWIRGDFVEIQMTNDEIRRKSEFKTSKEWHVKVSEHPGHRNLFRDLILEFVLSFVIGHLSFALTPNALLCTGFYGPGFQWEFVRSIDATAIAAIPSSRPMKPRCSLVVALTPTCLLEIFNAAAMLIFIASMCGDSLGC